MLKVAIVIPALNERNIIARCVSACLNQNRAAQEVIVVDNGSTDGTGAAAKDAGATVLVEPKRGRSIARNRGWQSTQADIIVFTDADCVPETDWLEELLGPFSEDIVTCVGGAIVQAEAVSAPQRWIIDNFLLDQASNFTDKFLPFAAGANVAFRRAVLDAIDGLDERLPTGEDNDVCWRMQCEVPGRLVYRPQAVIKHHVGTGLHEVTGRLRRYGEGDVLIERRWGEWANFPRPLPFWVRIRHVRMLPLRLASRVVHGEPVSSPIIDAAAAVSYEIGRLEGQLRRSKRNVGPYRSSAIRFDLE